MLLAQLAPEEILPWIEAEAAQSLFSQWRDWHNLRDKRSGMQTLLEPVICWLRSRTLLLAQLAPEEVLPWIAADAAQEPSSQWQGRHAVKVTPGQAVASGRHAADEHLPAEVQLIAAFRV